MTAEKNTWVSELVTRIKTEIRDFPSDARAALKTAYGKSYGTDCRAANITACKHLTENKPVVWPSFESRLRL